jgi:hypothetical protein
MAAQFYRHWLLASQGLNFWFLQCHHRACPCCEVVPGLCSPPKTYIPLHYARPQGVLTPGFVWPSSATLPSPHAEMTEISLAGPKLSLLSTHSFINHQFPVSPQPHPSVFSTTMDRHILQAPPPAHHSGAARLLMQVAFAGRPTVRQLLGFYMPEPSEDAIVDLGWMSQHNQRRSAAG